MILEQLSNRPIELFFSVKPVFFRDSSDILILLDFSSKVTEEEINPYFNERVTSKVIYKSVKNRYKQEVPRVTKLLESTKGKLFTGNFFLITRCFDFFDLF